MRQGAGRKRWEVMETRLSWAEEEAGLADAGLADARLADKGIAEAGLALGDMDPAGDGNNDDDNDDDGDHDGSNGDPSFEAPDDAPPLRTLRPDAFAPTIDFELEPGDFLYLPPRLPHRGTATTDGATTYSVLRSSSGAFDHVLK